MTARLPLGVVIGTADISDDGLYRYELGRRWADGPRSVTWVMLNPSTADAELDDQTIRRIVHYSKTAGYDAATVVNHFAYRTPSPDELIAAHRAFINVRGPRNVDVVADAIHDSELVVAAWGANLRRVEHAGAPPLHVLALCHELDRPVYCLGTTADGSPRHPARLGNDAELAPYHPPGFPR